MNRFYQACAGGQLCATGSYLAKELDPTRPCAPGAGSAEILTSWGHGRLGDGSREDARQAQHGDGVWFRELPEPGVYAPGWGYEKDKEAGIRYPWRGGVAVWCGFDHGSIWPSGGAWHVDYFRIPAGLVLVQERVENILPPEWPVEGTRHR
ncbi:MAG: hypothetical protein ACLT38_02100 [Akkermansia sp.]